MDDDDYDSEADSDYDPTKDVEAEADEEEEKEEKGLVRITQKRKFELDSIFDSMRDEEETSLKKKMEQSFSNVLRSLNSNSNSDGVRSSSVSNPLKAKKLEKKAKRRQKDIMSTLTCVFGGTAARALATQTNPELLQPAGSSTASSSSSSNSSISSSSSSSSSSSGTSATIAAMVRQSLAKVARRQTVQETRKFAGSDITVTTSKMMVKSQFDTDPSAATAGGGGSSGQMLPPQKKPKPAPALAIDSVLAEISGPKAISTVTKSSLDWDQFKETEKLEDDLANASKDGYLHRQDFLVRVDHRTFEKERDERLRKSAAGGGGGTGGGKA